MNTLRKRELLLSLKYSVIEGCFSMPMLSLTMGNMPFAIGFAVKALGWNPTAIGLMNATPFLCHAIQPPITNLLQRFLSLHEIILIGLVFNALPWAFVSLFPQLGAHTTLVFGVIIFTSSLANSICAVAWAASMSELVPLNIRGKYFGARNLMFGFWVLVVVLACGQIVDRASNPLMVFGEIFTAAAAARMIGLFFFTRMKFPPLVYERRARPAPLKDYLAVLSDSNYLRLILFIGLWGMFLNLGLPFYSVYLLKELSFRMGDLTLLMTLSSLGGLLSLKTWGALSDRFGNKPVQITCSILWSLTAMIGWLFTGPHRHTHLYALYFITGYMTAGFQLCQFTMMLKLVPAQSKAHYISVFLAVTSLFTAAGSILGGKILQWLPPRLGTFLGEPILAYHLLFAGSLLLCLLSVNVLQFIREPAERPWRELVRVMWQMREFNPILGISALAQFMFTPRGLSKLARGSVRSLRKQTNAVSDVGEELVEEGWRVLKQPFEKEKPDKK